MPSIFHLHQKCWDNSSSPTYQAHRVLRESPSNIDPTICHTPPFKDDYALPYQSWKHDLDYGLQSDCNEGKWSRISVNTYPTSTSSFEDLDDQSLPFESQPRYTQPAFSTVYAATPHEFAYLFPSTERMSIKHDDTTDDGNMNLRVDIPSLMPDGAEIDLTLFHLRMHDLKGRHFSLRRYCRDSGKEVCHSNRKYGQTSRFQKPSLQRSVSTALASFRAKSENKTPKTGDLIRQDSGYESMPEDDDDSEIVSTSATSAKSPKLSNAITLEFSSYAHLEIRRKGSKSHQRYEFEYWGTRYAWKCFCQCRGNSFETSYELVDVTSHKSIAHIVPVPLSALEAREEEIKGG